MAWTVELQLGGDLHVSHAFVGPDGAAAQELRVAEEESGRFGPAPADGLWCLCLSNNETVVGNLLGGSKEASVKIVVEE